MLSKWKKRKIKKGLYEYYKVARGFGQYSIAIFEYEKSRGFKMKIARRVTANKEQAEEILSKLIRNKVTICTFFDVISDLVIC